MILVVSIVLLTLCSVPVGVMALGQKICTCVEYTVGDMALKQKICTCVVYQWEL